MRTAVDIGLAQGSEIQCLAIKASHGAIEPDENLARSPGLPEDVSAGTIYQKIIQEALNAAQPLGDVLAEIQILAKLLRLDAMDDALGLSD